MKTKNLLKKIKNKLFPRPKLDLHGLLKIIQAFSRWDEQNPNYIYMMTISEVPGYHSLPTVYAIMNEMLIDGALSPELDPVLESLGETPMDIGMTLLAWDLGLKNSAALLKYINKNAPAIKSMLHKSDLTHNSPVSTTQVQKFLLRVLIYEMMEQTGKVTFEIDNEVCQLYTKGVD